MLTSLSILIPCFNGFCSELVEALHRQAEDLVNGKEGAFHYEILVADDGSTDMSVLEANRTINKLSNCRYIERGFNCGRSAIRNFLAREAQYDWLLFIDCHMMVPDGHYLRNYAERDNEAVTYGGYVINGDESELYGNLRFKYERGYDANGIAAKRRKHPYNDFHTSNFLVSHDVMLRYPLDERFRRYGYEDVVWGRTLQSNGVSIAHIDNPLSFERFETNPSFLAKTEEGMRTLAEFREELMGYSRLLQAAERLRAMHLLPLVACLHRTFGQRVRHNLLSDHPNVRLFSLYKLSLLCSLLAK